MDKRKIEENIFKALMMLSTFVVIASLVIILVTIFLKGFPAINVAMLTQTPKGGYYLGKEGGILNAILGSIILGLGATFLAFIISLPVIFYLNLSEGEEKMPPKFALSVRFFLDVLWGIPSIVYGAFGFTLMVFFGLKPSLLAGIITVALLIIPIMSRSVDEVLKLIPFELKEASYAMGATKLETAVKVVFRQALPGIVTAVLIAFGRGISDAASVLFTASFTDSVPRSLFEPVATLPLAIFFQLGTPFPEVQQRGYASAVVLTVIVLVVSIVARIMSNRFTKQTIK